MTPDSNALRFTATITLRNLTVHDVKQLIPSADVSVDVSHPNGDAYNLTGEVSNVRVQIPGEVT